MSAIRPNAEQFRQLAESPDTGPVVMVNLLKFKRLAQDATKSGRETYQQYGDLVLEMVRQRGGHVVWQGRADHVLIGDPAEDWDMVALVEYPSRQSFIDMVSNADYLKAHSHREAGLQRTIVVACTPVTDRTRAATG